MKYTYNNNKFSSWNKNKKSSCWQIKLGQTTRRIDLQGIVSPIDSRIRQEPAFLFASRHRSDCISSATSGISARCSQNKVYSERLVAARDDKRIIESARRSVDEVLRKSELPGGNSAAHARARRASN